MTEVGTIGQVIKKEIIVTGKIEEERIESQELERAINILVESAMIIHTKFYLNVQSFQNSFQVSLEAQKAHQEKFVLCAQAQLTIIVSIENYQTTGNTSAQQEINTLLCVNVQNMKTLETECESNMIPTKENAPWTTYTRK